MKTALIVLGIIIAYLSLGYAVTAVICAIEEEDMTDMTEDVMIGVAILWIVLVPLYIALKLIPWIGRKLAFIPVLIVALIKAKKEGE